jgi:hypothetical protein
MINCKNVSAPLPTGCKLERNNSDKLSEILPYQNLIGCLNYLALMTRPYTAFTASFLGQYNSCVTAEHWTCAKRVLRYLRKLRTCVWCIQKQENPLLGILTQIMLMEKTENLCRLGCRLSCSFIVDGLAVFCVWSHYMFRPIWPSSGV